MVFITGWAGCEVSVTVANQHPFFCGSVLCGSRVGLHPDSEKNETNN